MLRKKTVFVLGAGASKPYGFPLGGELTKQICDRDPHRGLRTALNPWIEADTFSKADIDTFVNAFERSGVSSIDAFLERRDEFLGIGTLAIAALLCRKEDPDRPLSLQTDENWYRAIWREMVYGAESPINALRNINFITFNYDRSLECFLFTSLRNAFKGVNETAALEHLKRIRILHVYGSLGDFNWQEDIALNQRQYRLEPPPESISAAATQIRLIPQGRDDGREFEEARTLLEFAEVICFLGFGFDETNMERLDLARVLRWNHERKRPSPRIVISTLHKTAAQTARIKDALVTGVPYLVEAYDANNLDTLASSALIS